MWEDESFFSLYVLKHVKLWLQKVQAKPLKILIFNYNIIYMVFTFAAYLLFSSTFC